MSDKIPKCPSCNSITHMHCSTFPKDSVYGNYWICLKCDVQKHEFKDIEKIRIVEDRDE